jgi:hypothetical protein
MLIIALLSIVITCFAVWLVHELMYVVSETMQIRSVVAVIFANIAMFFLYPIGIAIESYLIALFMLVYFVTTVFDLKRY